MKPTVFKGHRCWWVLGERDPSRVNVRTVLTITRTKREAEQWIAKNYPQEQTP